MSLKAIFEPTHIDIFHKYKEASELTAKVSAGTIVMKDTTNADQVKKSDGTDVWGLLSQDVFPIPENNTFRPYLNHQAYDGDQVGVYTEAGYYKTDVYVDGDTSGTAYAPGQKLYVSSEGKLTNVLDQEVTPAPTKTTGVFEVGRVVSEGNGELFFFFYGLNSSMKVA